jgi:hypothetical protein
LLSGRVADESERFCPFAGRGKSANAAGGAETHMGELTRSAQRESSRSAPGMSRDASAAVSPTVSERG